MICSHNNVVFKGLYSLIGSYFCENCDEEIDPVQYHDAHRLPHVELRGYRCMDLVKYDDFAKIDLRVATILEATLHPNADRLLVLKVAAGDVEPRQIVAGIKQHFMLESLAGKQIVIVANLEPREVRGILSQGMLLAASDANGLSLIAPEEHRLPGTQLK
jgi:methionine--tRNA ligase beta chain